MEENKLGHYLRELRQKHKLSQKEVASYLNISRQACSHYETGRINPPLDSLIAISKLYHIPLDEVLAHKKNEESKKTVTNSSAYQKAHSISSKFSSASLFYDSHTISEEIKLLHSFRQLTPGQKKEVIHFVEYITKK